ncbi:MAG TPA: SpoIID/LytB domain-containing protein [Terriglobia bacterium]|nr:SpoIID/LytB domain-containing protein [Terriglobia bacterium]
MNIRVGLMEGRSHFEIELQGVYVDASGREYAPGRYRFDDEIQLVPRDAASAAFAVENVTIGVGFHWERNERQTFRGAIRILKRQGLTLINDVALEEYVTSVISSEMSAGCPIELLKAHAVMSRSWLRYPIAYPQEVGAGTHFERNAGEIRRWYGRESHRDFDVCADDHCQRYQGVTRTFSESASAAVQSTAGEFLLYDGKICDARFYKCCGGVTEEYRAAWDDRDVPYLQPRADIGDPVEAARQMARDSIDRIFDAKAPAYCNTRDAGLLKQILPGFDQETQDFYRWKVEYTPAEIRELIQRRYELDLGNIVALEPLARGRSGRITRLRVSGDRGALVIEKELEIRRALSRSHLYSSAFVVERTASGFVLRGAGWGHGVGLCQIGAAVMAAAGKNYQEILAHYYAGTTVGQASN